MKRCFIALLCIGLTYCGGGGSSDLEQTKIACETIGLNSKVIGGEACADLGRSSVVRIMANVQVGSVLYEVPICTGTMVASDVVLTAQHCFISSYKGYPVQGLGIYYGEAGKGNLVLASMYSRCPGYRYESSVDRSFNDVALIKLSMAVNLPVLPVLLSRSVNTGETGYVYGYGATAENQDPADVTFVDLEAGAMTIQDVTNDHIFVSFDGGGVNVCNGDSGGPLVVPVDGQPALAGVVSQGSVEGCVAGDTTTYTNLQSSDVLNWFVAAVPNAQSRSVASCDTELNSSSVFRAEY